MQQTAVVAAAQCPAVYLCHAAFNKPCTEQDIAYVHK